MPPIQMKKGRTEQGRPYNVTARSAGVIIAPASPSAPASVPASVPAPAPAPAPASPPGLRRRRRSGHRETGNADNADSMAKAISPDNGYDRQATDASVTHFARSLKDFRAQFRPHSYLCHFAILPELSNSSMHHRRPQRRGDTMGKYRHRSEVRLATARSQSMPGRAHRAPQLLQLLRRASPCRVAASARRAPPGRLIGRADGEFGSPFAASSPAT